MIYLKNKATLLLRIQKAPQNAFSFSGIGTEEKRMFFPEGFFCGFLKEEGLFSFFKGKKRPKKNFFFFSAVLFFLFSGDFCAPSFAALEQGMIPIPVVKPLLKRESDAATADKKKGAVSKSPILQEQKAGKKTDSLSGEKESVSPVGSDKRENSASKVTREEKVTPVLPDLPLIEEVEQERVVSFSVANIGYEKKLPSDLFEGADFSLVSFLAEKLSTPETPVPLRGILAQILGTQTAGVQASGGLPAEDFFLFKVRLLFEMGFYEEALSMLNQIPVQKQTQKMQELSLNLLFLTKGTKGACGEFSAYSKAGQSFLQAQALCFRAQGKEAQADLALGLLAENPDADKGFLFLAQAAQRTGPKEDLEISDEDMAMYLTAGKIRPLYFFVSEGSAFPVLPDLKEGSSVWLLKEIATRGTVTGRIAALELLGSDSEALRELYLKAGSGLTLEDVGVSFLQEEKEPATEAEKPRENILENAVMSPIQARKSVMRRAVLFSLACGADKAADKIRYASLLAKEAKEKEILGGVLPALAPCVHDLTAGPVSEKTLFNAALGFLLDGKEKEATALFMRASKGKFAASKGLAHSLAPFSAAASVLENEDKAKGRKTTSSGKNDIEERFRLDLWMETCRTEEKTYLLECTPERQDAWISFWQQVPFADQAENGAFLTKAVEEIPPYERKVLPSAVYRKLARSRMNYQKAEMLLLSMYLLQNSSLLEEEAVQSLSVFGFEKEAVAAFMRGKTLRSVQ